MMNKSKPLEEHAQLLDVGKFKSTLDIPVLTKLQDTCIAVLAGFATVRWNQ